MSTCVDIMLFDLQGLQALAVKHGEKSFRGLQIAEWLYLRGVASFSQMTNLPKNFRAKLEEGFSLDRPQVLLKEKSSDKTTRYLLRFADGALSEIVAIPSKKRLTVCVSTQAGCAMGCIFCATGRLGLNRSLFPGEILMQLAIVAEDFSGTRVSNVVVMGQGEPFANYDATLSALRMMNDAALFGIGARHITVSTAGLVSQIRQFALEDEQFTLAVSLHSANQRTRNYLMPGLAKQPLKNLQSALIEYMDKTSRRPSLEYALIKDVNDSDEALASMLAFCDVPAPGFHVNLITLNAVENQDGDLPEFERPSAATVNRFEQGLLRAGISVSKRISKGGSIAAACGQLSSKITP